MSNLIIKVLKLGSSIPPEGWRPGLDAMVSGAGNPEVLSPLNPQRPDPQHSACRTSSGHLGCQAEGRCGCPCWFWKGIDFFNVLPKLGRWDPVPCPLQQFVHFALRGQGNGNLKLLSPVEMVMLESAGIAVGRGIPSSVSILKRELGK